MHLVHTEILLSFLFIQQIKFINSRGTKSLYGTPQIPAVYWWYKSASHAAELTAGYYNPTNQDGYSPLFEVLKKHSVTMKFICSGLQVTSQEIDEASVDPEGLSWQVIADW